MGILPLYNHRHASFLHNEVPGIRIPQDVMVRLEAAGGEGQHVGVDIALQLLDGLKAWAQGVYLMPPFGRYDMAAEIIERVRVRA